MITTDENYNLDEIIPKLKAYTVGECGLQSDMHGKICPERRRT